MFGIFLSDENLFFKFCADIFSSFSENLIKENQLEKLEAAKAA